MPLETEKVPSPSTPLPVMLKFPSAKLIVAEKTNYTIKPQRFNSSILYFTNIYPIYPFIKLEIESIFLFVSKREGKFYRTNRVKRSVRILVDNKSTFCSFYSPFRDSLKNCLREMSVDYRARDSKFLGSDKCYKPSYCGGESGKNCCSLDTSKGRHTRGD